MAGFFFWALWRFVDSSRLALVLSPISHCPSFGHFRICRDWVVPAVSTGLYCTVLYCTVLYCTVPAVSTGLYCTVLYCTVLCRLSAPGYPPDLCSQTADEYVHSNYF